MALSLDSSDIKVISRLDDSLDKHTPDFTEIYTQYLRDLDESKLPFIEGKEPTRFKLRRVLEYKVAAKIKNDQIKIKRDLKNKKDFDIDMNVGSVAMEDVRASLIDIEHPPGTEPGNLAMKTDINGLASFDLVSLLESYGIVSDLYQARTNLTAQEIPSDAKKK